MAATSLYPRAYVSGINFEVVHGRVIKVTDQSSRSGSAATIKEKGRQANKSSRKRDKDSKDRDRESRTKSKSHRVLDNHELTEELAKLQKKRSNRDRGLHSRQSRYLSPVPKPVLNTEEIIAHENHYFKDQNNNLYSMPKGSSALSNYPTVIENVRGNHGRGITPGELLTADHSFSDGESFLNRHRSVSKSTYYANQQIESLKEEVAKLSQLLDKKMRSRQKERNDELEKLRKKRRKMLSREMSKSLANLDELKRREQKASQKEKKRASKAKKRKKPHKTIIVLYPQYLEGGNSYTL